MSPINGNRRTGDAADQSVGNIAGFNAADHNRHLNSAQAENTLSLPAPEGPLTGKILHIIAGHSTGEQVAALVGVLSVALEASPSAKRGPDGAHKLVDGVAKQLHHWVDRPLSDACIVDFRAHRDARNRGGA
jgi:hypothetical protein